MTDTPQLLLAHHLNLSTVCGTDQNGARVKYAIAAVPILQKRPNATRGECQKLSQDVFFIAEPKFWREKIRSASR